MTAVLEVEAYNLESRTSRLFSTYPIRLIESLLRHSNMRKRYREHDDNDTDTTTTSFVTIFVIGFGGGSVNGDSINMTVNVGIGASMCMRTQGASKVYKTDHDKIQQQTINCNIHANGFLVMIPDHTVCYEDSNYKQEQIYNIKGCNNDNQGSLVLVDWVSSGRLHGGRKESSSCEFWKMRRLRSTIQINDDDANQCLFLDNLDLYNSYDENNDIILSIGDKVGGASIFGSIVLVGPRTQILRERVSVLMQRQSFQKMKEAVNSTHSNGADKMKQSFCYHEPLVSVSTLSSSLIVIRFATASVEDAYILVKEILHPLGKVIGQYPYADKVHTTTEGNDWHCIKELRNYDSKIMT